MDDKLKTEDIPSLKDLGLEDEGEELETPVVKTPVKSKPVKPSSKPVDKINEAKIKANATAAIAAAASAQSKIASNEADKTYIIQKKKHMLNRCKSEDAVEFVGLKLYAQFFGPVYTFLYNTIPVTVKFDGSKQKFPRFVYNHIMRKISEVSESNTNKDETFDLGSE